MEKLNLGQDADFIDMMKKIGEGFEKKKKQGLTVYLDTFILKSLREDAKLTQKSLATILGVSERHIKRLEKTGNTKVSTANSICEIFDVSLPHLQGKEGLTKYIPYYHYRFYPKTLEKLNRQQKLGKTTRLFGVFEGMANDIDEFFSDYIDSQIEDVEGSYSRYKYKVSAKVTVDRSQNIYYVDINSCLTKPASNINTQRFEIRPFTFTENGMSWYKCADRVNQFFELNLGSFLEEHVTEYIFE